MVHDILHLPVRLPEPFFVDLRGLIHFMHQSRNPFLKIFHPRHRLLGPIGAPRQGRIELTHFLERLVDPRHFSTRPSNAPRIASCLAWTRIRRMRKTPPDTTAPTVAATADLLPGWRPHHLKTGAWGSIYLGDTSALPPDLVGARITMQSKDGQSWTTTGTAVLDRSSEQVIVTNSGRPK